MTDVLTLNQVYKWVGDDSSRTDILNGVSMNLRAGEFIAIMGASGSGKSTLLNLIGLLDTPSAGTILFNGRDISKLGDDEMATLRARAIGFVFQTFNLLSYLNAHENVELPMGYTNRPDAPARAKALLGMVHLEHRLEAYPSTLSGGERQRVAIARALANNPALILADEPTGALDSKTGVQILDIISHLNQQGAAVVLVTHDEAIARRAQRILRMKDGRFA